MLKFIVASDLHLSLEGESTQSLDAAERLRQAVKHINAFHPDAEFCIFAGDLADKGEVESYKIVEREISGLAIPYFLTNGNHDDRENFRKVFPDSINPETGRADHRIDAKGHCIFVLDSLDPGVFISGRLSRAQLDWLRENLAASANNPVLIIIHHQISKLHVQMDKYPLINRGELIELLRGHPEVRLALSGHVHMNSTGVTHGIPFGTLAGSHYNIAPRSSDEREMAPRLEGPCQYAVVNSDEHSTVILYEDYLNWHRQMPPELFR